MKKAIVVETADIKKLLAEKYNVPDVNIIKNQYSFTVILEGKNESTICDRTNAD